MAFLLVGTWGLFFVGLDLTWVALATAVRCRWGVLVIVVVLNCTRTRGGSPRSCRCLEFSNRLPLALAGLSLSLTSVVGFLVISISILIGQPVKCCRLRLHTIATG